MNEVIWTSSPWGFRQTPLAEQCRWLAEHEMQYICGQCFDGMAGVFDPKIDEKGIADALALTKRHGLQYASFNGDGDFMVARDVDAEVAHCCKRIDIAAKFSPKVIIVFAGWQDRADDAVYAQVADALKQVTRHAAKYNLTVALENHGGLTATAAQVNRILDAVREPNIGVNYDPANFLMYGADPYRSLIDLQHPIVFTHLKSLKTVNGRRAYCRVSEGEIDYTPILKWLTTNYSGFYGIEYEETSDVLAGSADDLRTLQACLARVRKG
jgi:sugar phosphate isomerase/epimerase